MYGDNCNGRTSYVSKYAVKFDRNWEGLHDAERDLLAIAKFIVLLGSVITISHEPCSRHTVNNSYTQGVPRSCRVMENDYKVVEFSITVCTNYSNWQTVISNQWFTQYALNRRQSRTTLAMTFNKQLIFCRWHCWLSVIDSTHYTQLSPTQCRQLLHLRNFWSWKINVEKEGTPCILAQNTGCSTSNDRSSYIVYSKYVHPQRNYDSFCSRPPQRQYFFTI